MILCMIGIYKFTNKITGESYISQSSNIQNRYNQHKNRYDKFASKDKPLEDIYFHFMRKKITAKEQNWIMF